MNRIEQIIGMMKEEAEEVDNPDPVARIYNVYMKIEKELIDIMKSIREKERGGINEM